MKKAASALVLTGALTFLGAGAASAYVPTPPPATSVGSVVVAPGGTVTVPFTGFAPNEQVIFTLVGENGAGAALASGGAGINGVAAGVSGLIILNQPVMEQTLAADATGAVSIDVKVPTEPGTYTLTGVGQTSGNIVTATIVVDAALAGADGNNAAAGNGLADTGADSTMLLWGAAGALALGAGIVSITVAQRKKTA